MSNATRWVGIDLHRRRSHIAMIDDQGELSTSRRIVNDREAFLELLGDPQGEETQVALEATYGWEWLAELLEEAGYDLHLAHPLRTRAIAAARVKTDAVDARTLAHLLRADLLPEAYVAPRELRDLRELLRHRVALTGMRSALKNRVHAILAKHGITREHSDLFGKGGREFLAELELRDAPRRRLDSLIALIDDFDREIDRTTSGDRPARQGRRPRRRAHPDPRRRPLHRDADHRRGRRHRPLPDRPPPLRLGRADPDRPQLRRQGTPRPHLPPRITALRWALVEAAQKITTGGGPLRDQFERIAKRRGAQDRQGRRRPPDPHPQLLRPARRRDPLPGAPQPGEREREAGGPHDRRARTAHGLRPRPRRDAHAQASSTVVMASLTQRRPPT